MKDTQTTTHYLNSKEQHILRNALRKSAKQIYPETTTLRQKVAKALNDACRKEFGSTWNNDVALYFADVALKKVREALDGKI